MASFWRSAFSSAASARSRPSASAVRRSAAASARAARAAASSLAQRRHPSKRRRTCAARARTCSTCGRERRRRRVCACTCARTRGMGPAEVAAASSVRVHLRADELGEDAHVYTCMGCMFERAMHLRADELGEDAPRQPLLLRGRLPLQRGRLPLQRGELRLVLGELVSEAVARLPLGDGARHPRAPPREGAAQRAAGVDEGEPRGHAPLDGPHARLERAPVLLRRRHGRALGLELRPERLVLDAVVVGRLRPRARERARQGRPR